MHLGAGDGYGEEMKLRQFQRDFIHALYEVNPKTGVRQHTRAVLMVPKGAGKTQLAAAIAAYELCGNVHVDPLVAVCATSFEQSDILFSDLRQIMLQSPDLAALTTVLDTEILLKNEPGRAYRVAAVAGTSDGARPTAVVFDEVHELMGNKARVHLVLSNGTSKRKGGFTLSISTAGWDPESLLAELYDHGIKVNSGEVEDESFLFTCYQADENVPLKSRADWRKAIESCNPAAGDFLDLESVITRAMELPIFESKRYMLNNWTTNETQWEVAGLWDGLRSDLQLDPALPTFVGIDVGVVHDSSAVVCCQRVGDKYVIRSRIWSNPFPVGSTAYAEWRFEIAEIEDFCRGLYEQFPASAIRNPKGRPMPGPMFCYDPSRFIRSAQLLEGDGLNLVEFPQHESRLVPMSQNFYELAKEGLLAHDGDPTLASHVRNVVATQKARGWRISKPAGSHRNIDAATAAGMALQACAQQEPPAPEPRIRVLSAW